MKNAASVPIEFHRSTALSDYVALTKPRLNLLVVLTSATGYYLGAGGVADLVPLASSAVGTACVAAGAAVLNQVYELDTDGLMDRTRMRPLPDGRVETREARVFGLLLSAIGLAVLATVANLTAAALALATLVIYLLIYTPMKRRTPIATLVGAIPGALPPLIGWTAAHGSVSTGGVALFVIVFFWQIPHFMAIAWMYRFDYAKGGFPLLAVIDPTGRRAGRQAVAYSLALLIASAAPSAVSVSGRAYLATAMVLGVALTWLAVRFAITASDRSARQLFFGSIVYLPLLWIAMIADRL